MKNLLKGVFYVLFVYLVMTPLFAESERKITNVHELEVVLGSDLSVNSGEISMNIENIPYVENVNITNHASPQNETAMAVNPADTRNLVVSMNDFRTGVSGQSIAVSRDGGASWVLTPVAAPENNVYYIDPSAAFDNSGTVYIAYLAVKQSAQVSGTGIVVLSSADGGTTWSEPVYVANDLEGGASGHSRPFLTVNKQSGEVLVSWVETIGANAYPVIARSSGKTMQFNDRVRVSENSGVVRNAIPAVAPNGDIYVTYFDLAATTSHISKSTNNGQSFSSVHSFAVNPIGEENGFRRILKSALKVNSYPSIAIDNSNLASSGNIYVVWADNADGQPDIFMIASSDNGSSWSEAVKVNNDATDTDQFFPAVTVDDVTGAVNIAFYDSRNDENNLLVDTYLAQSFDGGETFINTKITTAASNPEVGFENRGEKFFGDYLAVVSYDDVVFSAYTDSREGNQEVFVAKFDKTETDGIELAEDYFLNQNYPNPFNPETVISFNLKEETLVTLSVYNALGQKVTTLIDNQLLGAENHVVRFHAEKLTGGIYFYRLQAGNFVSTRKMVYLK